MWKGWANMLKENNIPWKQRIKELLIDYLVILIYLLILFGVSMVVFFGVLGHVPTFSELQSQLIAAFASVLPIILIFAVLDYKKGSIGKKKAKLTLYFRHRSLAASLLRNVFKFLPWQLAHTGVIHGMYTNFDLSAFVFIYGSMILALIMLLMGLIRKDKRHLGDFIAGTQVQVV